MCVYKVVCVCEPLAGANSDCSYANGLSSMRMAQMAGLREKIRTRQKFAKQKLTYAGQNSGSFVSNTYRNKDGGGAADETMFLGRVPAPSVQFADGTTGIKCNLSIEVRWEY